MQVSAQHDKNREIENKKPIANHRKSQPDFIAHSDVWNGTAINAGDGDKSISELSATARPSESHMQTQLVQFFGGKTFAVMVPVRCLILNRYGIGRPGNLKATRFYSI